VLSKNLHRRHLTPEQRRRVIAAVLKQDPKRSDRRVAEETRTDHKTVGKVREQLEGRGEIPHVDKRSDSKGREQPAARPGRGGRERAARPRPVVLGGCTETPAAAGPEAPATPAEAAEQAALRELGKAAVKFGPVAAAMDQADADGTEGPAYRKVHNAFIKARGKLEEAALRYADAVKSRK
jgi:hypothetical protein